MRSQKNANKDKIVFVSTGAILPDGTILENLHDKNLQECKLAVMRNGALTIVNEYRDAITGTVYRPKFDDVINRNLLMLPSEARLAKIDGLQLVEKARRFLHRNVDLHPAFEQLAARYMVMSSVFDAFETIPYMRVLGPYGMGKSRCINVMGAGMHHSLRLGTGITPAGTFRMLAKYPGASLLFDEANFDNMTRSNPFVQILNGGYCRTGYTIRCNGQSFEPQFYPTFGPKLLAGNSVYEDPGLESRILTGNAILSVRDDLPDSLPPYSNWPEAEELRNDLLAYRLGNLGLVAKNPRPAMPEDFKPRFREVVAPLFQATGETVIPSDVLDFLENINYQQTASNAQTEEAYVVYILAETRKLDQLSMPVGFLAKELNDRHGLTLTARKVGGIVRTLGIPMKARSSMGISIDLTSPKIEELAKRYRLPDKLN